MGWLNDTTVCQLLDGTNSELGVRYCGWNAAVTTGVQSRQLSRTARSADEITDCWNRTSVRAGIQSDSLIVDGMSNAGSEIASPGAFSAIATPNASWARMRARRATSSVTSSELTS